MLKVWSLKVVKLRTQIQERADQDLAPISTVYCLHDLDILPKLLKPYFFHQKKVKLINN